MRALWISTSQSSSISDAYHPARRLVRGRDLGRQRGVVEARRPDVLGPHVLRQEIPRVLPGGLLQQGLAVRHADGGLGCNWWIQSFSCE